LISDDDRDIERLELIVELAEKISARLKTLDWNTFLANEDERDLLAFRLLHIGESSHKLSTMLKERYADVEWQQIYRMRNILSHDYLAMDALLLWESATIHLSPLVKICRVEIKRILS
jgi:uncharacterized protein with HEPN domain